MSTDSPKAGGPKGGATAAAASGSSGPVASGPALALFAKVPEPGQVKTRLCPPLTAAEAAGLYGGFLRGVCAAPVPRGVTSYLYGWPGAELERFDPWVPVDLPRRPQQGADLWERMARCMDALFGMGHGPVAIRNTDSPDLPTARIAEAFERVGPGRVVFGPDPGGGYYLVALAAPCPRLFEPLDVPADQVLVASIDRAERLGLQVELLPEEPDVDTWPDLLALWQRRLDASG